MDVLQANMRNLTKLWETGGERSGRVRRQERYTMSVVVGADWPNKLWFHERISEPDWRQALDEVITYQLTVLIWGSDVGYHASLLEQSGLTEKTPLTGMSLELARFHPEVQAKVHLERVRTARQAELWANLFAEAFGYRLGVPTILFTQDVVDYYIGFAGSQPFGTAVLYQEEAAVVGIHSMGVIPHQRRKGYARALLNMVLAEARERKAELVTLQASAMGKGLYEQLGFKPDFLIHQFYHQF